MPTSLWFKLAYTIFVLGLVPIYWRQYGAANFLWFSDIALILYVPAIWLESSLLVSVLAVSVLLLEVAWILDYIARLITGKKLLGLSSYMFDRSIARSIRALSLFHIMLPPLLLISVKDYGYDSRSLLVQTMVCWIVLTSSYLFTKPKDNINWVYGFGDSPQTRLPRLSYLLVLMIGFPLLVYLPSHLLLTVLFAR